jgi:uncharacterized membrane protein
MSVESMMSAGAHRAGATPAPLGRYPMLDALRGVAMVWMTVFHLSFDLNHQRLIAPQNFYLDPFWTMQRLCIVSLFLWCAGASQAVAMRRGVAWAGFWRRWAQVAGCAALVSLGSAWMFPNSWISFGVLHGMAVMGLLARLLAPCTPAWAPAATPPRRLLYWVLLPLVAAAALALPWWVQSAWFDTRWTNWIGLVTQKPITEDFVPVLPWFGVMALGLWAGSVLCLRPPRWWTSPLQARWQAPLRMLARLGRWSLSYYMLHQPVLIGLISLWVAWRQGR